MTKVAPSTLPPERLQTGLEALQHLLTLSSVENAASLPNQHENLGLRGTVTYLFAVIFTADQVPTDLLVTCQQAIDERNNVVHQGQRDVPEARIAEYLLALRHLCGILERYSGADKSGIDHG